MKNIILFFVIFLFIGCSLQVKNTSKTFVEKQNFKIDKTFTKVNKKRLSKWIDKEKIPLNVIIVYKNNKESKELQQLAKFYAKHPKKLGNLYNRFPIVKYVDYKTNEDAPLKYQAMKAFYYSDVDGLNDVLRPDKETNNAEIMIEVDNKELKNGNLTIKGYKTVKDGNNFVTRNSFLFVLRKKGYSKLNKKQKQKAIKNAFLAILNMDIPKFTIFDRKEYLKKHPKIYYSTPFGKFYFYNKIKFQLDTLNSKLFDIYNKQPTKILNTIKMETTGITTMTPDGKYGLISEDGYISLMNLKTWMEIKALKIPDDDRVYSLAITPDAKYAVSGNNNSIIYWDLKTGKMIHNFNGFFERHGNYVVSVDITPDGKYALSSSWDGNIKYWDLKNKKLIKTFRKHSRSVMSVVFSLDYKHALSGSWDETAIYWNLLNNDYTVYKTKPTNKIEAVALSNDNRYALVADSSYGRVTYWDLKKHKVIKVFKPHSLRIKTISFFKSNNRYVLTGGYDDELKYWDLKTGKILKILKSNKGSIITSTLSNDGQYAFSGCDGGLSTNGTAIYWQLYRDNQKTKKIKTKLHKFQNIINTKFQQTKQILLTKPFSQKNLKILKLYGYLDTTNLNLKTIKQISDSLNYTIFDPILNQIKSYRTKTGNIIDKHLNIRHKTFYNDELYFCSYLPLTKNGYINQKTFK